MTLVFAHITQQYNFTPVYKDQCMHSFIKLLYADITSGVAIVDAGFRYKIRLYYY